MPHSKSARKRLRQNEKGRLANRSVKSEIRTIVKRVDAAVEKGDLEAAERELSFVTKKLDKAVKKRIYHKNTVARRKSQLAKKVNQLKTVSTPA